MSIALESGIPRPVARERDGRLSLWVCSRCGYVYAGEAGEPKTGTPACTPFESLPESWVCPDCGADKDYFFH